MSINTLAPILFGNSVKKKNQKNGSVVIYTIYFWTVTIALAGVSNVLVVIHYIKLTLVCGLYC